MHRVSIELASTVIESEGNCCVLAQSRAAANGAVVTGNMDQAFVSYPALFKHLAFDGSFLHGVPDVMRRESYEAARCYGRPTEFHSRSSEPRERSAEMPGLAVRGPTEANQNMDAGSRENVSTISWSSHCVTSGKSSS